MNKILNKLSSLKSLLFVIFLAGFHTSFSQQFWFEDFGNGCNKGNSANGHSSSNGIWTVTSLGTNGTDAHEWYISSMSSKNLSGCDAGCSGSSTQTDRTLHVSTVAISNVTPPISIAADTGAYYFGGGYCSAPTNICVETNKRVESPTINCSAYSGITLSFEFLEGGTAGLQNAYLEYFDGTQWDSIYDMAKLPNGSCGISGQWFNQTSISLPSSADLNANVKIGFRWKNKSPGTPATAIDYSFSVDKISLSATPPSVKPTANFVRNSPSTICEGDTANFSSISLNADSLYWLFPGATPSFSNNVLNPTVTYNTAGIYNVTLYAFNNTGGKDTMIMNNAVNVNTCNGAPTIDFTVNNQTICRGDTVEFTNLSTGSALNWYWILPGSESFGTPINAIHSGPVVYDSIGTFPVTLLVEYFDNGDTLVTSLIRNNFISVIDCPPPIAGFSTPKEHVCIGNPVKINDESLYADNITWSFPQSDSNKYVNGRMTVYYSELGTYLGTQLVTNAYGSDAFTDSFYVSIEPLPLVDAGNDRTIYRGEFSRLTASGDADTYWWTPADFLSCQYCETTESSPDDTISYTVYAFSEYNCQSSDFVTVNIEEQYYAGIPDIFSPNLDNINDRLFVIGNGIAKLEFVIFDRTGNEVYHYSKSNPSWDGSFKGRPLEPGIFTYYANVKFLNGQEEFLKGHVSLIR